MKEHSDISILQKTFSQIASCIGNGQSEERLTYIPEAIATIQPKPIVGAPDYPLEEEADAMDDNIIRMQEQNFIQHNTTFAKKKINVTLV